METCGYRGEVIGFRDEKYTHVPFALSRLSALRSCLCFPSMLDAVVAADRWRKESGLLSESQ